VPFGLLAVVDSADQLRAAYAYLRSLNPVSLRLNVRRVNGRSQEHISDEELRRMAEAHYECFLHDLDCMGLGIRPVRDANICSLFENICLPEKPYMCQRSPCGAGTEQVVFDWAGKVWPCQEFIGDDRFATPNVNAGESPLVQLRSSRADSLFAGRSVENINGCRTCNVRAFCQSGCSATAWYSVTDTAAHTMNVRTPHCQYYYTLIPLLLETVATRPSDVYQYVFAPERGYRRVEVE
jgi:radical SAM protein with 4Fe4S-binding SPASM domain